MRPRERKPAGQKASNTPKRPGSFSFSSTHGSPPRPNVVTSAKNHSDGLEDEAPCSSSSILQPKTPSRMAANRPKPDKKKTRREMSVKRPASSSFSSTHGFPPRPNAGFRTPRKGATPTSGSAMTKSKWVSLNQPFDFSIFLDETSEMNDNEMKLEDEAPCSSSSILQKKTPSQSAAIRPKSDKRRSGRDLSEESNRSRIGSPKKKTYLTISDAITNEPIERFRTDILNQIRAGDYEFMVSDLHFSSLRLTDTWKEEWNEGVQVPLHSTENLPRFDTEPCDIPAVSKGPWRLPRDKYLLSKSAPYEKEETHEVHAVPPLRIYQGDRMDELWLKGRNSLHATHIDLPTMLDLMNEFEIDCFKCLHRVVQNSLASASSTLNSTNMVDEEAPCDVCKSKDCDDDDPMIFCDGCNICLHLTCYGLTAIPEGNWECDMCKAVGFARHDRLKCAVCPNTGGAMKEVEGGSKWAHLTCAMWIPEIRFTQTKAGHLVVASLDSIPDRRWQLKCCICDQRMGACIQCNSSRCVTAFHTTCAQKSGAYEFTQKVDKDKSVEYVAYCKRHTKERKKMDGASGNNKDTTKDEYQEMKRKEEVLREFEGEFFLYVKFEKAAERLSVRPRFASDVYEYWKLKRHENGGKPLINNLESEITVETEKPIIGIECEDSDGEEYMMLRASDDVQHQLTPFQLKCWRFQKHVFQSADRGRTGCDIVMKRERQKLALLNTNRDLFHLLIDLDNQPGIPLSSRAITQIIEGFQADLTPEEIAECDRMAEEMVQSEPPSKTKKRGGGEKKMGSRSKSVLGEEVTQWEPLSKTTKKGGGEKKMGSRSKSVLGEEVTQWEPPSKTKKRGGGEKKMGSRSKSVLGEEMTKWEPPSNTKKRGGGEKKNYGRSKSMAHTPTKSGGRQPRQSSTKEHLVGSE